MNIHHWLATRRAKRESEADPQWPGSVPVQFVGQGHRVTGWQKFRRWAIVVLVCFVVFLGYQYVTRYMGADLAYLQAISDEYDSAAKKEAEELRKQDMRQAACGGEESEVIELAHGGFACLDKHGRRRMPAGAKQ